MKQAVVCLVVAVVFGFSGSALAAEGKAKAPRKSAKQEDVARAPATEPSPAEIEGKAVASCQKHVESMLRESAETRFSDSRDTRVQPATDDAYDVAGWVTSKTNDGMQRRGGFNCHAKRYGTLWTTKTSLAWDQ